MSPIDDNGFLAQDIQDWIEKHRKENSAWFEISEDLNKVCHKMMFKIRVHRKDNRELLAAVLYIRILGAFQGIILLCERGMIKEAQILERVMLEALFKLGAIANHKELVKVIILEDEQQRLKDLRRVSNAPKNIRKTTFGFLPNGALDKLIEKLEAKIVEEKTTKVHIEELSKKAGLHEFYITAYSLLSSTVHSRPKDLEDYIEIDDENRAELLLWGPDVEGIDWILDSSIGFVFSSLEPLSKVFKLGRNREVVKLFQRFLELEKSSPILARNG